MPFFVCSLRRTHNWAYILGAEINQEHAAEDGG
jgi:hypothetical protein